MRRVHDTIDDSSPEARVPEETVRIRREGLKSTLKDTPAVSASDGSGKLLQTASMPNQIAGGGEDEIEIFNTNLELFADEYLNLPSEIRTRAYWNDIMKRLLANNSLKLHMVEAMQGEGQLFGIDMEGRALFKDRGTHPVMYGYYNGNDKTPTPIYDRNQRVEELEKVVRWATGEEIYKLVIRDGYELFRDDGRHKDGSSPAFGFGEEMMQVKQNTGKPFIACKSHNLMAWVQSGEKSNSVKLHVAHSYRTGHVDVNDISPTAANDKIGVVRLLRV